MAIVLLIMALPLHAFMRPADYVFEKKLAALSDEKLFSQVSMEVLESDLVCIFPFYSSPKSLGDELPDSLKTRLAIRINKFFGVGDHVWWVAVLHEDGIKMMYRVSGKVRPDFQRPVCAKAMDIKIVPGRITRYAKLFGVSIKDQK